MMALGQHHGKDDERTQRSQITDAAVEALLRVSHLRSGQADTAVPALYLHGGAND